MASLIVTPEIHCLYGASREVISCAGDVARASFVIVVGEKVQGDPYRYAGMILDRARRSPAYGIGLKIAIAHLAAQDTIESGGNDVDDWLRIPRQLAAEIFELTRPAAEPTDHARQCRECGITEIGPEIIEIDGQILCWVDDDLCSICQDRLRRELEQDAARYRHLRGKQVRTIDIEAGCVFAGRPANGRVLAGEDLDRAIDSELGADAPVVATLESRLADCLADIVDAALMTGTAECHSLEIRLGFFLPELSERAAVLLEEAGR